MSSENVFIVLHQGSAERPDASSGFVRGLTGHYNPDLPQEVAAGCRGRRHSSVEETHRDHLKRSDTPVYKPPPEGLNPKGRNPEGDVADAEKGFNVATEEVEGIHPGQEDVEAEDGKETLVVVAYAGADEKAMMVSLQHACAAQLAVVASLGDDSPALLTMEHIDSYVLLLLTETGSPVSFQG